MRLLILICIVIFISGPVSAKKPKDKKSTKHQQESSTSVRYGDEKLFLSASLFTTSEVGVLNNYRTHLKSNQKKIPKGLQKKMAKGGSLPPGWQKKLNRGEPITRDTYRYAKPLPETILVQLPKPPAGTIIVEIDGEIVRLVEASLTIIDILGHH